MASEMLKLGGAVVGGLVVGALGVYAYNRMTAPAGQVFVRGANVRFPIGAAIGVLPGAGQIFSQQPFAPVGLALAAANRRDPKYNGILRTT